MDGSTGKLVHMGVEAVVLLGVTFYMNSQIRSLKTEIRELRAKIEEDARENNKHLNSMYMVIDQLQKSRMNPFIDGPTRGGGIPPWMIAQDPHNETRKQAEPMQLRNRKRPVAAPKPKQKIVKFQEEVKVEEVNDLDAELQDELKAIDDEEDSENLGQIEAQDTENSRENEEAEPEPKSSKKQVKEVEGPFSDLAFVQSAIRQVPRKQAPTHSQKNA
jgi:flagellar capping protein FliD